VPAGSRPLLDATVSAHRARVETRLHGCGRVVLRASGTEPVVRVTIEADDLVLVESLAAELAATVLSAAVRGAS